MEDVGTVEICRAQIWQWIHHEALLSDGRRFTPELFRTILKNEIERARLEDGGQSGSAELDSAGDILDRLATERRCPEFISLPSYCQLESKSDRPRKSRRERVLAPLRGGRPLFCDCLLY